ncbi:MAG: hypothetical protein H7Y18_19835 [Clostridiaceae bacterium]|nr:hypothetical protein [Clostridiaceae bacterium]
MNKNYFTNLKFFSSIYLKLKEKTVNSLDLKVKGLENQIEKEKKLLEENNQYLDIILLENTSIKGEYYNHLKLFKNENKSISIRNNNYNISIWENVFIRKQLSYYVIQTKKEEDIYTFNKSMNNFIDYFLTLDYSIVVLSVSEKRITLQLRLL